MFTCPHIRTTPAGRDCPARHNALPLQANPGVSLRYASPPVFPRYANHGVPPRYANRGVFHRYANPGVSRLAHSPDAPTLAYSPVTQTVAYPPDTPHPPNAPTPKPDNLPRGVTVSTLDSESSGRGSNPREASVCPMLTCENAYMRSDQNTARWPCLSCAAYCAAPIRQPWRTPQIRQPWRIPQIRQPWHIPRC